MKHGIAFFSLLLIFSQCTKVAEAPSGFAPDRMGQTGLKTIQPPQKHPYPSIHPHRRCSRRCAPARRRAVVVLQVLAHAAAGRGQRHLHRHVRLAPLPRRQRQVVDEPEVDDVDRVSGEIRPNAT